MTDRELDSIIDWCRRKAAQKKRECGYMGKRGEGYEEAMLAVMSHLHGMKPEVQQKWRTNDATD